MPDSIFYKVGRVDPLGGLSKKDFLSALKEKLADRAQQAYVYGSFTKGNFTLDSDIDVLLICDTKLPFTQRAAEFFDLRDEWPRVEYLVYTKDEFAKLINEPIGFWKEVRQTMQRFV